MSFLELQQVSFAYPGGPAVVDDLSLALDPGGVLAVVGRSGCGKTTVLKLAAGLLQPSHGRVLLQGRAPASGRDVGFVFQSPTLLDWLTVRANVLLPVSLRRRPTPQDVAAADTLLDQLGLPGAGTRRPRQLSGGQQSRVALARALLPRPALLLLDEPFAALDAITREELQQDLLEVVRTTGTAVLLVTHDIAEAVVLADQVAVLSRGRLVHARNLLPHARRRDTPAFGAASADLRAALGLQEVPA